MITFSVLLLSTILLSSSSALTCERIANDLPTDWITMQDSCVDQVIKQINMEFTASYIYMAMGAHFSNDKINRPGFAHLFLDSSKEEREHAIKLMEYLTMRGKTNASAMSPNYPHTLEKTTWNNGKEALDDALNLEAKVTIGIRDLIKECEEAKDFNDYHFADYLITEYLEEQYKGQRDLAGKTSELTKMMKDHGVLGEWMYDKKLLS